MAKIELAGDVSEIDYRPPTFTPLQSIRIVDEFPWGGPDFGLTGRLARIVGMEARVAPMSDIRYGNDPWDYKLEIQGGGPPVWLPSSAIEANGTTYAS